MYSRLRGSYSLLFSLTIYQSLEVIYQVVGDENIPNKVIVSKLSRLTFCGRWRAYSTRDIFFLVMLHSWATIPVIGHASVIGHLQENGMHVAQPMAIRWGFAGAGKIVHDFGIALSTLPRNEHEIYAIAEQGLPVSRAEDMAQLLGAKKVYGNFKELAEDEAVDIVHVAVLNPQHWEVTKLMLNHGKHVLCEKPMAMNFEQTQELINLAKSKNLFLMEGISGRSFPAYAAIMKEIESGSIGDVKQVIATIGLIKTDVDRLVMKKLGGGTILDLGVYATQFATFIYDEAPVSIVAAGHLNAQGVDQNTSAVLTYRDGRTATLITHTLVDLPNKGYIVGTKGMIEVTRFWNPTSVTLPRGNLQFPLPESPRPGFFPNSIGLRYEAQEIRKCLEAGLTECPKVPHRHSLIISQILDELHRQLGVDFTDI